jgi:hypothetical protein
MEFAFPALFSELKERHANTFKVPNSQHIISRFPKGTHFKALMIV